MRKNESPCNLISTLILESGRERTVESGREHYLFALAFSILTGNLFENLRLDLKLSKHNKVNLKS